MSLREKLLFALTKTESIENRDKIDTKNGPNNKPMECNITSKYFTLSLAEQFINIELEFNHELSFMVFNSPVDVVYNPIEYAFEVHKTFVNQYLQSQKTILFLGMNPGPFGMGQTGVPFGSVPEVKDWLKIVGEVKKPIKEIPARPVLGFNCQRIEQSGKRFWGVFKEICGTSENFFRCCFVHNLCPLIFLTNNGRNVTPSELKGDIKQNLLKTCERWLLRVVHCLGVKLIIGIGRFAQERALRAVKSDSTLANDCKVEFLPHPSPRSVGNTNWNPTAIQYLTNLNLIQLLKPDQGETSIIKEQ